MEIEKQTMINLDVQTIVAQLKAIFDENIFKNVGIN